MTAHAMTQEQFRVIEQTVEKERGRLLNFIRKRVKREEDAEDIMQDVFFQLVNMYDSIGNVEKVTSWLYTVARNKITDSFRKKKPDLLDDRVTYGKDEEKLFLQDILPDVSNDPDALILREMIWTAVQEGLNELPKEQREVFVGHEFDDKSFKEMAAERGETVNTLLSRKRYAVLHLRTKLKELYENL